MSWILVKYSNNYADEFDIEGFALFESEDLWNDHLKDAKNVFEGKKVVEQYFGTNESVMYDSFDEYVSNFEVFPITCEEAEFICKTLAPFKTYGHFLSIEPDDFDSAIDEDDE